jgi:hypothetical protein
MRIRLTETSVTLNTRPDIHISRLPRWIRRLEHPQHNNHPYNRRNNRKPTNTYHTQEEYLSPPRHIQAPNNRKHNSNNAQTRKRVRGSINKEENIGNRASFPTLGPEVVVLVCGDGRAFIHDVDGEADAGNGHICPETLDQDFGRSVHVDDSLVEDADSEFGNGEDYVVKDADGVLELEV